MVSPRPQTSHVSPDRLQLDRLRRLLADLGLQTSFWAGDGSPIAVAGAPGPACRLACADRCGETFLAQFARDALADAALRCRSCGPGACTLAARLDPADPDSPLALGCFVVEAQGASGDGASACAAASGMAASADFGQIDRLATILTRVTQEWYACRCEQAGEVEALSRSLAETYEELSFLYRQNEAIDVAAGPKAYFQELADELRNLLAAEAILIVLSPDPSQPDGSPPVTFCAGDAAISADAVVAGVDTQQMARRGYHVHTLPAGVLAAARPGAKRVLCTPLLRGGRQLGLIAALRGQEQPKFNNIDLTRISSIARSTAMVAENFRLYDNLRQLFLGTVRALIRSIDAKDPYTCGHSERVAAIARRLFLAIGGSESQADRVYLCGLLHDVGKIGIAESVLCKPGRLTSEEYEQIKRHPPVGATILDGIRELEDILPGVLHHHERFDGRGYPSGLAGQAIPLYARVLAVADTFDAMTSARTYRVARSVDEAVAELRRHAGTQFDPALVDAFVGLDLHALIEDLRRRPGESVPAAPRPAAEPAAVGGPRMNVTCEDYDKVAVVGVDGELSADTLEVFRTTVERKLGEGRADFVVSFERISSVDSAGLEALLSLQDECRRRQGELKLAALDETAATILTMTRLDRQFDVHPDVVRAVRAFGT